MLGKLLMKRGGSGSESEKGNAPISENQPLHISPSQTRELRPSPSPHRLFNLSAAHPLPSAPHLTRILHPKPDALSPCLPNNPFSLFEWILLHLESLQLHLESALCLPTPIKPVEIEASPPPQLHVAPPVIVLGTVSPTLMLGCLGIACLCIGGTIYSRTVMDRHESQLPFDARGEGSLKQKVESIVVSLKELEEWVKNSGHQDHTGASSSNASQAVSDISTFLRDVVEEISIVEEKHDRIQRVLCILNRANSVVDACFLGLIAWKAFGKPGFFQGIVGWVVKMLSLLRRG